MLRRYLAEFVGTFCIVFAPVALAGTRALPGSGNGLIASALVSGLAVAAMVHALGAISAAHFNPAVTLGFALARRFPFRFMVPYWAAQIAGSVAAAGVCAVLFGPGHGTHHPLGLVLRATLLEGVLTFFLMLVIMAVATDARVNGAVPGLAIGAAVVWGVLVGGPVSGGSMNPARSLGPALLSGGINVLTFGPVYVMGPCVGAALAAYFYEFVRTAHAHAQNAPNDLSAALQTVAREK